MSPRENSCVLNILREAGWQGLENAGVSGDKNFFVCFSAKSMNPFGLQSFDRGTRPQNIERLGLIAKILRIKELRVAILSVAPACRLPTGSDGEAVEGKGRCHTVAVEDTGGQMGSARPPGSTCRLL